MNELRFALQVKHYLDAGIGRIDERTAARLHEAREQALARATGATGQLAGNAGFHWRIDEVMPRARRLAALVAIAVAVAGLSVWNSVQQAAEYSEVDTALLAEELPIDAYLDSGFDAWLRQDTQPR